MIPRQPMALRPLVLLTLAVAGVHLAALLPSGLHEPARPPSVQALATRMVERVAPAPSPSTAPAPLPAPTPALAAAAVAVARAAAPPVPQRQPSPIAAAPASAPTPTPAIALAIPAPVRLKYTVTGQARGKPWTADGQLQWRHDGSQYEALLEYSSALLPARTQRSAGRITAEGLAPDRFSDRNRGEQATHFQRDKGTVVFSNNAPEQLLLPGTQDRLSVLLQLAAMVAAEPAKFPAGTSIALPTAGARESRHWLVTVDGEEMLDLPGGQLATRKLVRQPRGEYDIRIELWLGTRMDYVPVRLRLTQPNGDFVDQQWASTDRP
jgi:hypothetical protein